MSTLLDNALKGINEPYKTKIKASYIEYKKAARLAQGNRDYTSPGVKAGVVCEVILRFLQDQCGLQVTPFGQQIHNFGNECRSIVDSKSVVVDGLKKIMPRVLVMVYSMRGNRGIGHAGGDVDANEIDAGVIEKSIDWLMSELIRVYHKIPLEDAQSIVDSISERNIPSVWSVNGKKRVLLKGLSAVEQTLIILYGNIEKAVLIEDLNDWIEYGELAKFRNDIARRLHSRRLAEYDDENEALIISPLGITDAESILYKNKIA